MSRFPVDAALFALLTAPLSAQLGSLTTTFADNGGRIVTPPAIMMDVTVTAPAGLKFVAVDVNSLAGFGGEVEISVWVTSGTYLGNEMNPAAWTKVSEGRGVAQGRSVPTPVDIRDFHLAAGSYGLAIYYLLGGAAYTNGANTYTNADLSLTTGAVSGTLFQSVPFTPRTWNGTWYYFIGNAVYGSFGAGCAHAGGTSGLAAAVGSLPRIGTTFTTEVDGLDPNVAGAFVVTGLSNTTSGGQPLPLDLGPVGAPGCRLLVEPLLVQSAPNLGGLASTSLGIPVSPSLIGVAIYQQGIVPSPSANPLGLAVTNGGEGCIGL